MNELLDQLEASLASQHYYLSLMTALTIPDMAGALDSPDGRATGKRYAAWFEQWIHPEFCVTLRRTLGAQVDSLPASMMTPPLTGDDCYRFRCSLLHQGTTQHPTSTYSRILFVEPRLNAPVMHYNIMNDALNIDLPSFCLEIIGGTRKWLAAAGGTEPFESNVKKFVHRYPNGVNPYIGGVAVIG